MKNPFRHDPPPPTVEYPETAQNGGHPVVPPNADSHYFDTTYPAKYAPVGVLPSVEHPDAHWLNATRGGHFVQYVGEEPHGLEIDVDPTVDDINLIRARGHGYGHPIGETHVPPVAVCIVETPVLFGIEKRISTNAFTLAANSPIQICSRRLERTRLQLTVSTLGPIVIGPTYEQVSAGVGYIVSLGQVMSFVTNQPLFATSAVASVVSVLEEFTTVEGAKRV